MGEDIGEKWGRSIQDLVFFDFFDMRKWDFDYPRMGFIKTGKFDDTESCDVDHQKAILFGAGNIS
jgi:hypothetical protein